MILKNKINDEIIKTYKTRYNNDSLDNYLGNPFSEYFNNLDKNEENLIFGCFLIGLFGYEVYNGYYNISSILNKIFILDNNFIHDSNILKNRLNNLDDNDRYYLLLIHKQKGKHNNKIFGSHIYKKWNEKILLFILNEIINYSSEIKKIQQIFKDSNYDFKIVFDSISVNTCIGKELGNLFIFDFLKLLYFSEFNFNGLDKIHINDFYINNFIFSSYDTKAYRKIFLDGGIDFFELKKIFISENGNEDIDKFIFYLEDALCYFGKNNKNFTK